MGRSLLPLGRIALLVGCSTTRSLRPGIVGLPVEPMISNRFWQTGSRSFRQCPTKARAAGCIRDARDRAFFGKLLETPTPAARRMRFLGDPVPISPKLIEKVEARAVLLVQFLAEAHAPQPRDPRLTLAYPLASRRTLTYRVNARGDTTETQVAFESVGRNGAKRVIDALVRCTSTDRADERILTTHTQVFASRDDVTPAFRFVQTIIIDNIKGTPETGCRWDDLFMAVVDETGVYRPPVARVKTFL